MGTDLVHHWFSTVDYLQHILRKSTILVQHLCQQQTDTGSLFGRFQHKGVAGGNGERKHPQRNHGREIERTNAGTDTEWFAVTDAVHSARNSGQRIAQQLGCNETGALDHFESAKDIPTGVLDCFAVFQRNQTGQIVGVFPDFILQFQHDALTLLNRNVFPFVIKRVFRRLHDGIEFTSSHFGNMAENLARRRILNGMGGRTGTGTKGIVLEILIRSSIIVVVIVVIDPRLL
mmetsp:Transcript_5375/g.8459  ORF Transcript_5375/g.8459 Transcript_5375/m.8459 type:complete len:232 (+) Transcript_5375:1008-1703(+)